MKGGTPPREDRNPRLRLGAALRDGILKGGLDAVQSKGLNSRGAPSLGKLGILEDIHIRTQGGEEGVSRLPGAEVSGDNTVERARIGGLTNPTRGGSPNGWGPRKQGGGPPEPGPRTSSAMHGPVCQPRREGARAYRGQTHGREREELRGSREAAHYDTNSR